MGELLKLAVDLVRQYWRRRLGLVIAIFLAAGAFLYISNAIDWSQLTASHVVGVFAAVAAISIIWHVTNRVPKAKKGNIGIGVAIIADNEAQTKKLQADFIKRLRELSYNWHPASGVSFVEFPAHVADRVVNRSPAEALRLLERSRCHFILYGQAREREINGRKHVLDLSGIVRHAPITQELSARFGAEFADLFPKRMLIEHENDLLSFEFTAAWIDVVARYIVGIAALLSGDDRFAERAFLDLDKALTGATSSSLPAVAKIRNRLPHRIAEVYKRRLGILSTRHHMTRDKKLLIEMEQVLDALEKWDSNYYGLHLSRAMCHFSLRRDVSAANLEIRKCQNVEDGTWLWSKAFLEVYSGDLMNAWKTYQLAFRAPVGENIHSQCEEFIHCVLEEEPDKGQLHFALGLINYRFKSDYVAARRDLERFLDWVAKGKLKYSPQVEAARKWIRAIDKESEGVVL